MSKIHSDVAEQILYSASNFIIIFYSAKYFDGNFSDLFSFAYMCAIAAVTLNAGFLFSNIFQYDSSHDSDIKLSLFYLWAILFSIIFFLVVILLKDWVYVSVILSVFLYDFARRFCILLLNGYLEITALVFAIRLFSLILDLENSTYIFIWFQIPAFISLISLYFCYAKMHTKRVSPSFVTNYARVGSIGLGSGLIDYSIQYAPGFILFAYGGIGGATAFIFMKNIFGILSSLYQFIDTVVYKNLNTLKKIYIFKIFNYWMMILCLAAPLLWFVIIALANIPVLGHVLGLGIFYSDSAFFMMLLVYLLYPLNRIFLIIIRLSSGVNRELRFNIYYFSISMFAILIVVYNIGVSLESMVISMLISHVTYAAFLYLPVRKILCEDNTGDFIKLQ